jgi:transcriptional regulator with GAF, ATPase, and Fis domain
MAWDPVTKYKLLLEINNAIINQTSRQDLFRTLSAEIGKLFVFDRFSINIYDPETESLTYFSIAEGVEPEDMAAASRPLDKGPIARAVITSRQPLVIPDMTRYSRWPSP